MKKLLLVFFICVTFAGYSSEEYTYSQCQGSLSPYPENVAPASYPDSLRPIFINHVGRHGARFPSSASNAEKLLVALSKAKKTGTITSIGNKLFYLTERIINYTDGRWGMLDSLGMAEQRGIASRMYHRFRSVFESNNAVCALASYSPRAMMSMYCFTNQLDIEDNHLEFSTSTGRNNSYLMRPFETDSSYLQFRAEKSWTPLLDAYMKVTVPTEPIERALGKKFPFTSDDEKRELAMAEYTLLAGMEAMGMKGESHAFLTLDEMNRLWRCYNLKQYYERTATTVSSVPADIAGALLLELITSSEQAIVAPYHSPGVLLRFGHAETMMPLLSLMNIEGCNYPDDKPDEVSDNWKNFYVVPMASNLQMILFRSVTGKYYIRTDLNEQSVPLIPGDKRIYIPWQEARQYLLDRIPAGK